MDNTLQIENFSLRQQLEALLHEARLNEEKMRRFDQLERQLIGANSLIELVRLLLSEYQSAFGVEFVSLTLVDREYEATRILAGESGSETGLGALTLLQSPTPLAELYRHAIRPDPVLGAFDTQRHQALFNAPAGAIASVALLPLSRHGELIGSLHFGSADPGRYVAGCGTAFLERLTEVIAICLESALTQERLKLVGLTDGLTGVQNRRYFEHRCQVEVSQARRYKHALACMFLDVDKFKRINDTCGHQAGDEVLRSVAGTIQSQLRAGDTIARYGGEEFVVLLPQTEPRHAAEIAERIRRGIAEKCLATSAGQKVNVTISIGLSMLSSEVTAGENCQPAEQMVAAADKALYRAKHTGRNRVVFASDMSPAATPIADAQPTPAWRQRIVAASSRLLQEIREVAIGMRERLKRA